MLKLTVDNSNWPTRMKLFSGFIRFYPDFLYRLDVFHAMSIVSIEATEDLYFYYA